MFCKKRKDITSAPVYEALDAEQLEAWRLQRERALKMEKADITYLVINTPDDKFGYSVFIDGELYMEQHKIPAITVNKGFESKEEAENTAELVITKIRKGQMPPAVTEDELRRMGVRY